MNPTSTLDHHNPVARTLQSLRNKLVGESTMKGLPRVLYVNHREQHCGVYQFGASVYDAIKHSTVFDFIYADIVEATELFAPVTIHQSSAVIYNYHPSTMPWMTSAIHRKMRVPQIGTMHEVTQEVFDNANTALFDFHLAPDPTLLLTNPIVFKTGRLIPVFTAQPHSQKLQLSEVLVLEHRERALPE